MTRRFTTVTVVLLALASGTAATPASAAPPPRAARGVLGARTTLTWSGTAAIRLAVPHATRYAAGDVDLVVKNATYAFVRLVQPASATCPAQYGPRCVTDRVSWIAGLDDYAYASRPAGRRHDAAFGEPALIAAPYLDVVMFTDGRATLTISTTSLKGRTSYTPAAPVHGAVRVLAPTCAPLGCDTPQGRANGIAYGGATYDLQGAGWAEAYIVSKMDDVGAAGGQLRGLSPCMFPNPQQPTASPDAADHPYGCLDASDAAAAVSSTSALATNYVLTTDPLSNAETYDVPWSGAARKQYIGYQAHGAGPGASHSIGYGIWFRFLG